MARNAIKNVRNSYFSGFITMKKTTLIITLLMIFGQISPVLPSSCEGCWTPKLAFDIDGRGFLASMTFIAGMSYALEMNDNALKKKGVNNFYCKKEVLTSKELVEILNRELVGVVDAETVTNVIEDGLRKNYPC